MAKTRTVIDIKTPRGPTKRVTDRVSPEDTRMNDIGAIPKWTMPPAPPEPSPPPPPSPPPFSSGALSGPTKHPKRVTDRVSAEDTMNDIGMRKRAETRDDDAPNGNVEVGPITPMKKGGKVKAPKKFSRGGGIEVRGKTKGRFV